MERSFAQILTRSSSSDIVLGRGLAYEDPEPRDPGTPTMLRVNIQTGEIEIDRRRTAMIAADLEKKATCGPKAGYGVTRGKIKSLLQSGTDTVEGLQEMLGLHPSTILGHIKILAEEGMDEAIQLLERRKRENKFKDFRRLVEDAAAALAQALPEGFSVEINIKYVHQG